MNMTDQFQSKLGNPERLSRRLPWAALVLCLAFGLAACDRSQQSDDGRTVDSDKKSATERRANPVESKDGVSYIPIDDTAFLIPEKTWLKGYGRNSTDGAVSSITLHATVPDVQPWSQERHEEMYWPAGPGKKLLIYIERSERESGIEFSNSLINRKHIEESSDQAAQGLRQFRRLWHDYSEDDLRGTLMRFGPEQAERMRTLSGKPMKDYVYYEFFEENRVKYRIGCDDERDARQLWMSCHLYFPLAQSLMVRVHFVRNHLSHIVTMAEKLREHLGEFEAAGLAYRAAKTKSKLSTTRQ